MFPIGSKQCAKRSGRAPQDNRATLPRADCAALLTILRSSDPLPLRAMAKRFVLAFTRFLFVRPSVLNIGDVSSHAKDALLAQTVFGQNGFQTTVPTDILTQFRYQCLLWTTNVWIYANRLFGLLALIEFTWSAVTMVLDKTDLQSWTSALTRKIMRIGAFYALLINGRFWIPAIIDSFEQIGSGAAGMSAPLSPSDVMSQGIQIAGVLLDSAGTSGSSRNPGPHLRLSSARSS
jgi:hypothetical protein